MLPNPTTEAGGGAEPRSTARVVREEIFGHKELSSLMCSCEKDEVAAWDTTVLGRLKAKNAAAHKVLLYTNDDYAALQPDARAIADA